ncbi:type III secretion system stalk subunit SctO [Marinibactrum halimedae]|uniref:Preprotein translocase O n=1 Tax=Marinibactrum halimedae TaxID=1444977 RepID=A0AA37T8J5_9GAMM|nr:YscO family type III secretion system apparatus protein [Marinibactrum halimedae]MCD9459071.1 type III secretion protein [Marinibactrum halimedae]GLS24672.1 preprotein translocase O [Marinibactrum halimedae]
MSGLQKIKELKQRKVERAETEFRNAKKTLNELKIQYEAAVNESIRYTSWRIEEEDRLYQCIEKKILQLKQLDTLRERIALMHEKGAALNQKALELENSVEKAEKEKAKCQKALRKAEKDVEKYQLLIEETVKLARIFQERQSEELLDEFASARMR